MLNRVSLALQRQIRKHQILSRDIKFGITKFQFYVTAHKETQILQLQILQLQILVPSTVEREGLVKMYIKFISRVKIIYSVLQQYGRPTAAAISSD